MNVLAFDTSTELTHIGLQLGTTVFSRRLDGGAKASSHLVAECLALIDSASVTLSQLDAIAFGSGPGSFTGLRTACAVAQGFGFGVSRPLIAVPTLMAVAMDAHQRGSHTRVLAALDARMREVYAARWEFEKGVAVPVGEARALSPNQLALESQEVMAGNAHLVYAEEVPTSVATYAMTASPQASALLACAVQLWNEGKISDAADARPLYVRDQVALTEAERAALKATPVVA